MTIKKAKELIKILSEKGLSFDNGLIDEEVLRIEEKFDFKFPPDLRLFLQTALPVSRSFVHWRYGLSSEEGAKDIRKRFEWVLTGMLFDVEKNNFWVKEWGAKPKNKDERIAIVKQNFNSYPKLIPIYSHRFIPSLPNEIGNPVFSVYQMDIIYYGYDLCNYLANEFRFILPPHYEILTEPKKTIHFWSDCVI
jgi:hypothetical protein